MFTKHAELFPIDEASCYIYTNTLEMSPNRDVEDHLPPKLVDLSSPNSHETQLLQLTTSTTIHLKTKNSLIFYVVQKHIVLCFLFHLLCSTYSLTLLCTTNKQ